MSDGQMSKLIPLAALAVVSSCGTPGESYVKADRATFDVLAPAYRRYVQQDAALDQQQRDRRMLTIETWRMRIESAEGK